MCGEYRNRQVPDQEQGGSPPRVWGILVNRTNCKRTKGITPTCVGNTQMHKIDRLEQWDHPHVCGEYLLLVLLHTQEEGSPPRVWGIPRYRPQNGKTEGITPTCVGNTKILLPENAPKEGSPPRVWGIPEGTPYRQGNYGITPTCVGNTDTRA